MKREFEDIVAYTAVQLGENSQLRIRVLRLVKEGVPVENSEHISLSKYARYLTSRERMAGKTMKDAFYRPSVDEVPIVIPIKHIDDLAEALREVSATLRREVSECPEESESKPSGSSSLVQKMLKMRLKWMGF